MKRLTTLLLAALALAGAPQGASAQSLRENNRRAQEILMDDRYYNGTGTGRDEAEAGEMALQILMNGISTTVVDSMEIKMEEVSQNGNISSATVMNNVVKSYTAGHLEDVKTLVLERKAGHVRVMRYVAKARIDALFRERGRRVIQYVIDGLRAEQDLKIDEALKSYNWAYGLLRSVLHASSLTYAADGPLEGEKIIVDWLPKRIGTLLSGLQATVAGVEENGVRLLVTYNGERVASTDMKYVTADNREETIGVKNGMAFIPLRTGQRVEDLDLHYEYAYEDEMRNDNELRMVARILRTPEFPKSRVQVITGNRRETKAAQARFQAAAQEGATPHENFMKRNQARDYMGTVLRIAEAVRQGDYASVQDCFTPAGYEIYDRLLHYGQARVLAIPELHCYPYRDKVICRSIPMQFTYQGSRRRFTEDVYFTFNAENLIECVAFGLDKATRSEVYSRVTAWGDEQCEMLATFLEDYKTAWALKRLDYIRGIFADDARIITAHVLKPAQLTNRTTAQELGVGQLATHPLVRYTEQNKQQYLQNLERCFSRNEFINIRFTDCMVRKMNDPRYCINIRQDYYSTTYSDTGFLCLMVDVTRPEWPLIQYRTWMPERDPEVNSKWREEERASGDGRWWGVPTGSSFE